MNFFNFSGESPRPKNFEMKFRESSRKFTLCSLLNFGVFASVTIILSFANFSACLPEEMLKGHARMGATSRREASGEKALERRELELFHSHRNRRFSSLIPVRDRISNAICSYEVITDINFQRIPSKIDRVICKTDDCKVIGNTDYKCAQLYAELNVTYPKENCRLEFELMNIEYACICAKSIGSTQITVIEPVFTWNMKRVWLEQPSTDVFKKLQKGPVQQPK